MSQYQRNLMKLNNIPGSSLSQAAKNRNKIIFNLQNTFKDGKCFPEILHIVVDKRSITGKTGNIVHLRILAELQCYISQNYSIYNKDGKFKQFHSLSEIYLKFPKKYLFKKRLKNHCPVKKQSQSQQ